MTSTLETFGQKDHSKIGSLEGLLKLVKAPDERFLLGFFCRCLSFTIEHASQILAVAFDLKALKSDVEQFTHLKQDIAASIGGTHELKGHLNELHLYAVFTTKNLPETEPKSFPLMRAMLLVALTHPDDEVPISSIKTMSSLFRNYTEKASAVEKHLMEAPKDLELWQKYFSEKSPLPKSWSNAIQSLLSVYESANRHYQIRALFNEPKPLKKNNCTKEFTRLIVDLNTDTEYFLLGTDFLTEPESVDLEGLAPSDKVDSTPLLASATTKSDETPLLHIAEKTKTLINHQNWFFGHFNQYSNNVLLDSEVVAVFVALQNEFEVATQINDLDSIEQIVALYLTVATSWSLRVIEEITLLDLIPSNDVVDDEMTEGLSIQRGLILFRIPDVSHFWKLKNENVLFKETSKRVQLFLPSIIVTALKTMQSVQPNKNRHSNTLFTQSLDKLQKGLFEKRKELRKKPKLQRFSLERLRKYLPISLYTNTHDTADVMLITGQSHGLSTAPLHYYQADETELQRKYDTVFLPLLSELNPAGFQRQSRYHLPEAVGSKLQLPDKEIKSFIKQLIKPLKNRPKELPSQLIQFNQLARYLSFLIMATTGHRNTLSLGRLTANDFETDFGMALLSDKLSDPGHRARLVALPIILCQQINIYRKTCLALSSLVTSKDAARSFKKIKAFQRNQLSNTLQNAGLGAGSLLFTIDPLLNTHSVDNSFLKEAIPIEWDCKLNFFRHRLATQLRKQNAFPEYIHHQLGHIESGNQPFGRKSTLKPEDFIAHMQEQLNELADKDGWKLAKVNISLLDIEIDPAREISFSYKKSQINLLDEEKNYWRNKLKSRTIRKIAEKKGINIDIDRVMQQVIPGYQCEDQFIPPQELSDAQLSEILLLLLDGYSDNGEQLEWRSDFLRRRLIKHRENDNWKTPLPRRIFRPLIEPSPFMPGSLSALKELKAIREWTLTDFPDFKDLKRLNEASSRDFLEADYYLTRLVLILILAGGFFNLPRLFSVLKGLLSSELLISQTLPDTLVIPIKIMTGQDTYRETSETLSGVCVASAVAWLKHKPSLLADEEQLNNWVYEALPKDIKPRARTQCLAMLASTVEVGHRFEVSGLCYAIETGDIQPISLAGTQLIDVIDNRAYQKQYTEEVSIGTSSELIKSLSNNKCTDVSKIRKWYLSLVRNLHSNASEPKTFPLSKLTIHPAQFTTQLLKATTTELNLWQEKNNKDVPGIIQGLLDWAKYLLSSKGRRDKRGPLRISSAYTYITRFSGLLVDLIRDRDLYTLSSEDFVSVYLIILKSKSSKQISEVLGSLMMFHQFMVAQYGIDNIETDELWTLAEAEQQMHLPEAIVVTPRQYQWSIAIFDQWMKEANSTDTDLWTVQAAKITLILQYRFYIRTGEAHRLRLVDIQLDQKTPHIRIATTSYGRTKSRAGNRIIPAQNRITNSELNFINDWIETIKALWITAPSLNALLFPQQSNLKLPLDRYCIVQLITKALRHTSPQSSTRPHSCRHSLYSYQLLSAKIPLTKYNQLLENGSLDALGQLSHSNFRRIWTHTAESSYRITNEFSSVIGHSSAITSISHYFHLHPLIMQSVSDKLWTVLNLREQAELGGVNYANLRKNISRKVDEKCDASYIVASLDSLNAERNFLELMPSKFPTLPDIKKLTTPFDFLSMAEFILALHKNIPAHVLANIYNLSHQRISDILIRLIKIQDKTGFTILNNSVINNAYTSCSIQPPSILDIKQFKSNTGNFQRKRLNYCLQKIDNLQKKNSQIIEQAQLAFLQGYRQQQNHLSFTDISDANRYLQFIADSKIGTPNIKIINRVMPGYNQQASDEYLTGIKELLDVEKNCIITETIASQTKSHSLVLQINIINSAIEKQIISIPIWFCLTCSMLQKNTIRVNNLLD